MELLHPDDRPRFREAAVRAAVERRQVEVEYRLRKADGTCIHVRQATEPLQEEPASDGGMRWFNTLQDVTEQKRAEAELRESELRFRQLAENIREVFWLTDPGKNEILYVSPAYEDIWGRRRESVYAEAREWIDAIHPEDRERVLQAAQTRQASGEYAEEYRIRRPDGSLRWIRDRAFPVLRDGKEVYRIAGIAEDITEQKQAQTRIERLNRVYAVLSQINALIVRVRDRDELFRGACGIAVEHGQFRMAWIGTVDRAAEAVKPVATAGDVGDFFESAPMAVVETRPGGDGLAGRAVRELKPVISNDVHKDKQRLMRRELDERGINSLALIPLILGGEAIGVFALYAADVGFFDDEEMRLLLELASDISFALEHIAKTEKLDYLAYYDELTGLANRRLFHERLTQHLSAADPGKSGVAVLIMDIERFKTVNDTLGRQAGDALLKQIAGRMKQQGVEPARLARFGADQFATVVPDVRSEEEFARRTEARMSELFGAPFRLGDTELRISAKAGIAMFPGDGADADALLRNAEAALKKAKASGERYLFYTQQMSERVAEKLALENQLRQALEKDEFVLHYQPKVDLEKRRIIGLEALIRWQSPERGLVAPGQFISLLEETGLILEVGAWALKRASLDHRRWAEQKLKPPRVAVNVSAIQLRQRDFVRVVEQAIMDGVAPTGIDLELTESLVMEDVGANIAKLKAVRELGVRIAIDDFGTGYSSLGYLAKLPVQSLKIDRSFIINMHNDADAMSLISTIISLAHSLRLSVVAEGVETEEQAKYLRLLRCDEMQGYLFSKPLPFDAIASLLKKN
jgi:diguanylate cyclase (GGDEF)-like protein/PAS domain S-box-containing protein